jgi:predicted nucleic acid-binding protein
LLFDTSDLIDYLRRSNQDAISRVEAVINGSELGYCSVVTEAELWAGIRNRRSELEAIALLAKFQIILIPVTSNIARLAGNLLRGKDENQIKAHFGDALIAASAIEVGEMILTADGRSQRVFGNQANYLVYK